MPEPVSATTISAFWPASPRDETRDTVTEIAPPAGVCFSALLNKIEQDFF
jgi:hypothetical protein